MSSTQGPLRAEVVLSILEERKKRVPDLIKNGRLLPHLDWSPQAFHAEVAEFVEGRKPVVARQLFDPDLGQIARYEQATNNRKATWGDLVDTRQFKSLFIHETHFHPTLWKYDADRSTAAHFDHPDSVMFQLAGIKVFALYPPSEHPNLYHHFGWRGRDRTSRADLERPDYQRFPRLKRLAQARLGILQPGDVLYIPSNYTHRVYSYTLDDGPIVAVNYAFPTPARLILKNSESLFAKAVTLARPHLKKLIGLHPRLCDARCCQ